MKKEHLRQAARFVAERRFARVSLARSRGVIPGARLSFEEAGIDKLAAVKTASDGEVGLLRDAEGNWRPLAKVQLVLVATPSLEDPKQIVVLGFDPNDLEAEFNRAAKISEKGNRHKSRFKTPIFLPLYGSGVGSRRKALSSHCLWEEQVNTADLPTSPNPASSAQALEVLKAGIAQGLGIHPNRIDLTFSFSVKGANNA